MVYFKEIHVYTKLQKHLYSAEPPLNGLFPLFLLWIIVSRILVGYGSNLQILDTIVRVSCILFANLSGE